MITVSTINNKSKKYDSETSDNIYIEDAKLNNETLTIKGVLGTSHPSDSVIINLIKENKEKTETFNCKHTTYSNDNYYNLNHFPIEWSNYYKFTVEIPYNNNDKYHFIILDNNKQYTKNITITHHKRDRLLAGKYKLISNGKDFTLVNKFIFSIVVAVYNTENYVEEAINSVINQSIGFEDNVQLILVDDGSTDNSLSILKKYEKKYPENIKVVTQKNCGQATARNNGLNYVEGDYVNFLDSDDILSSNTLEDVYKFFNKHYDEIDITAIPINFFERKNAGHMLNYKFNKTHVIDLVENPNNPQLSASSAFFKKEVFAENKFPTDVVHAEDCILINKILLGKKKYGAVSTATYYYRKRADLTSTIDQSTTKKEFFTDILKNYFIELIEYCQEKEDNVPLFIQYLIAYDLQWMLKEPELTLESQEEINEFWNLLYYVIDNLDMEIFENNRNITGGMFKSFFLTLKNKDLHVELKKNNVLLKTRTHVIDNLNKHRIWLDIVEFKDNNLQISGFLNSNFNSDYITIDGVKSVDGEVVGTYPDIQVFYTDRVNLKYLSKNWQYKHNFDLKIPVSDHENCQVKIRTTYHIDGDRTNYDEDNIISMYMNLSFRETVRISKTSIYSIYDSKIVLLKGKSFHVHDYSYKSILRYEYSIFKKILNDKRYGYKEALKLRALFLLAYPIKNLRNKQVYLFMDRPEQADDNGEHLFHYAINQDDNISKYYTVKKDSVSFKRLSGNSNVIPYGSFKHKLMFLLADKIITSHPDEPVINPFYSDTSNKDLRELYNGIGNPKIYFLQHGVTLGNISNYLKKYDKNLSLISTVSDKEHDSFLVKGYNYDEEIIQTLGFPRFDNLENHPRKQILIIPTWRNYLEGNEELFKNSNYVKSINNLLNSKIVSLSKKYGYDIVFKPHPRLNKYITGDSGKKYIDLIDINPDVRLSYDESYQKLFSESSLLITDYSSVFFDFAYLKKPVIYYHPFDDYHNGKSYYSYEDMGFGEVVENKDDLFEKISYYLSHDCRMESIYQERVDKFFKYHDKLNCKRVYDWIRRH